MKKKAEKKPVKKSKNKDIPLKINMNFEEAIKMLGTPEKNINTHDRKDNIQGK